MNYVRGLTKTGRLFAKYSFYKPSETAVTPFSIQNFYSTVMSKPKVYVTREITQEALNILQETCDVTSWTGPGSVPREELLKNVVGKDGLFCMLTDKIDTAVLDSAGSNLKIIATMSVGYDHLSVDEIRKRNIKIGYTPEILTDATAELTVALLLATSRRLLEANAEARNGGWKAWSPFWMCGPSLKGSLVGIVGFGRIGQEVAKRLQPFKVDRFLYYSRSERAREAQEVSAARVGFSELLRQSDFVIVTCALTPETTNLFNEEAFNQMKSTAVFINSSRGGVVDQDALVKALKLGTIWAAGLDVMSPEPLPTEHALFSLKNCVILPHIGSAAVETRNNMAKLTAENIVSCLDGRKLPAELIL